jgi:DNA-binding transcriptional regulator PaaX
MKRELFLEVLDFFTWGMDKLTRPTIANLLGGYEQYARHSQTTALLQRLENKGLLERSGRGARAAFTITVAGREKLRRPAAESCWDRPWDNTWRVVTFDLPMVRQKDRYRLWRGMRDRKLGLLQRSVWIWPHELESILRDLVEVEGLPECFCGFETRRLFLCTDAEVVKSAWDWEQIALRHRQYLDHSRLGATAFRQTRQLAGLAALSHIERTAHEHAFALDPLLPHVLWPKNYRGPEVAAAHRQFTARLRQRFQEITDQ